MPLQALTREKAPLWPKQTSQRKVKKKNKVKGEEKNRCPELFWPQKRRKKAGKEKKKKKERKKKKKKMEKRRERKGKEKLSF